ncbi:MAG: LamG domain-containing protein, partial [Planctomycetaceae bacterium]|nr:LamG domain-containing protein [Planctomycetaceae bacterium]
GRAAFARHAMAFACFAAVTGGVIANHLSSNSAVTVVQTGPEMFTHFNGKDDFIATTEVPFVEDTPFTVELWFRPNDARRSCLLTYGPVSLMTTSAADGVQPRVQLLQEDGSVYLVDVDTECSLNQWHHFALTFDGARIIVYINGITHPLRLFRYLDDQTGAIATAGLPDPLILPDFYPGSDTYIGANQKPDGPNPYPFAGDIGEVRIMDSVFYRGPFTPQSNLSPTSTTRALLHLTDDRRDRVGIEKTQAGAL